jgi:hypothetical protein
MLLKNGMLQKTFFERYAAKHIYQIYISPIVIDEINRTKDNKYEYSAGLSQNIKIDHTPGGDVR